MCNQFAFYHQLWINTWRSRFEQKTDSIFFCLLIPGTKVTRILIRSTWVNHVVHNTCTKHGRDIKTHYIWLTSILLLRKDWNSIRLDRMQPFFKKHFQLFVFQMLWDWELEESYTKKYTCHLDHHQRSHYDTITIGKHVTSTSAKNLTT